MGSEAVASPPSSTSRSIKFHLTGFKKFHNVDDNPTEVLMHMIPEFMKNRAPLPFGATIQSCTVLETAGIGALECLLELLHSSAAAAAKTHNSDQKATAGPGSKAGVEGTDGGGLEEIGGMPSSESRGVDAEGKQEGGQVPGVCKFQEVWEEVVVWVHFGVNSRASRFAIEQRAVNEATFRCPDEMGWQPSGMPIVEEDGPISKARESVFPTEKIVVELLKEGFDTILSWDAGRFVCNYVYYHSLRYAADDSSGRIRSLFVHVPPFSVIDNHTQLEFIDSLLQLLATYS